MNNEQFTRVTNALLDDCLRTLLHKGREYSGLEDRLANFKRGAAAVGVQPSTVLAVYAAKHWDSIQTFIRTLEAAKGQIAPCERILSEPIQARIMDLINYLLLLNALVIETREQDPIPEEV